MRVYFNPETKDLVRSEKKPGRGWRVLPRQLGVYWYDDQSQNQIAIAWKRNPPNYVFDPLDDLPLARQYTDQLKDLFT